MTNKIDILCYYDNFQESLFDLFFYPTYEKYLQENFQLIPYKFYTNIDTIVGWNTAHWGSVLINRFDILKEYIKNNTDKWCIFSDIDILFLDNFYTNIDILISSNTYNIYYMPEYIRSLNAEINGGFFLFRCTQDIYDFFDLVQENTKKMELPNDQIAITNLLKEKTIKQSILPRHTFLTNNNCKTKISRLIYYNSMKVFHATSCNTVMEKIQVLSSIYLKKQGTSNTNLWMPQPI